ncbi:MAG: hypothetical protein ABIO24_10780 [Saprospiraceae bacterium]
MLAKYLWEAGSSVIAVIAGMHLYLTFFTDKFSSHNKKLVADMQSSSPILTKELTMWKAWIGFNASHSSGGIFIGVLNFYLAYQYFDTLQSDHFFFIFNIVTLSFYVWVAQKYWFKTPLRGLIITLGFYVTGYLLVLGK